MGEMIKQWEQLEKDDSELKVEEGVRRGGRKLSKRMSELLGIFGGERENTSVTDLDGGGELQEENIPSLSLVTVLPLSLHTSNDILSLSSRNSEVSTFTNINHGSIGEMFREDKTLLLGCDWPAGLPSLKLTANERRGRKRKHSREIESDSVGTKKLRGDWSFNCN